VLLDHHLQGTFEPRYSSILEIAPSSSSHPEVFNNKCSLGVRIRNYVELQALRMIAGVAELAGVDLSWQ
jgi:hypothetical protein